MPKFSETGEDIVMCQVCYQETLGYKVTWRPDITESEIAGNVCDSCLKNGPPVTPPHFESVKPLKAQCRGTLYNRLLTHQRVSEFCFELKLAHDHPTSEECEILGDLWRWLESGKALSPKQIEFGRKLIYRKTGRSL